MSAPQIVATLTNQSRDFELANSARTRIIAQVQRETLGQPLTHAGGRIVTGTTNPRPKVLEACARL